MYTVVVHFTLMSRIALHLYPGRWVNNIPLILISSSGSIQPWAAVVLRRLFQKQYQPLPSQLPIYTPGWREAFVVKHLAQGYKCLDWDLNPHCDDLTTRNALNHSATTPKIKQIQAPNCFSFFLNQIPRSIQEEWHLNMGRDNSERTIRR